MVHHTLRFKRKPFGGKPIVPIGKDVKKLAELDDGRVIVEWYGKPYKPLKPIGNFIIISGYRHRIVDSIPITVIEPEPTRIDLIEEEE